MRTTLKAGVGLGVLSVVVLVVALLIRPPAQQAFAKYVHWPVPRSVKDLNFEGRKGPGIITWSEAFLSFTVESNAYNRIVQDKECQQILGPVFLDRLDIPSWFEDVRSCKFGYFRLSTNRWFICGPRRHRAEVLFRDETGKVYYYHYNTVR